MACTRRRPPVLRAMACSALTSRCAVLAASPIWRVNTSSTQARQIHFSVRPTASCENADRSSGSVPLGDCLLATAVFFGAAAFSGTAVLGAAFLGAAFLGAAFLSAAFLGAAFLGAAFLGVALLGTALLGPAFPSAWLRRFYTFRRHVRPFTVCQCIRNSTARRMK